MRQTNLVKKTRNIRIKMLKPSLQFLKTQKFLMDKFSRVKRLILKIHVLLTKMVFVILRRTNKVKKMLRPSSQLLQTQNFLTDQFTRIRRLLFKILVLLIKIVFKSTKQTNLVKKTRNLRMKMLGPSSQFLQRQKFLMDKFSRVRRLILKIHVLLTKMVFVILRQTNKVKKTRSLRIKMLRLSSQLLQTLPFLYKTRR